MTYSIKVLFFVTDLYNVIMLYKSVTKNKTFIDYTEDVLVFFSQMDINGRKLYVG